MSLMKEKTVQESDAMKNIRESIVILKGEEGKLIAFESGSELRTAEKIIDLQKIEQ